MRALLTIAGLSCIAASAQDGLQIARELANESTRKSAVAKVVASGVNTVPILLSLSQSPPPEVNEYDLARGLADAFGQLKTKEAIPFLITHLSLERGRFVTPNTWMKGGEVIRERMPAISALIQIGPEASKASIYGWERIPLDDQVAAIFVVSQVQGVPEARGFLSATIAEANLKRYWAEEGIKAFDSAH